MDVMPNPSIQNLKANSALQEVLSRIRNSLVTSMKMEKLIVVLSDDIENFFKNLLTN